MPINTLRVRRAIRGLATHIGIIHEPRETMLVVLPHCCFRPIRDPVRRSSRVQQTVPGVETQHGGTTLHTVPVLCVPDTQRLLHAWPSQRSHCFIRGRYSSTRYQVLYRYGMTDDILAYLRRVVGGTVTVSVGGWLVRSNMYSIFFRFFVAFVWQERLNWCRPIMPPRTN